MRISDWSSDVCSSDLFAAMPEVERVIGNREKFDSASFAANNRGFPKNAAPSPGPFTDNNAGGWFSGMDAKVQVSDIMAVRETAAILSARSEEHTSELQSLMRISYAVFCLKKKKNKPKSRRTPTI